MHARHVWLVARWEVQRYVKPKQVLMGMLTGLVIGGAAAGAGWFVKRAGRTPVDVVALHPERLGVALPAAPRVQWQEPAGRDLPALRALVEADSLDGVLLVHAADSVELLVRKGAPKWAAALADALGGARQAARLREAGIDPADVAAAAVPIGFRVQALGEHHDADGSRFLVGIGSGLVFLAVMSGMGTLFLGITGEKQQRVTEQLLSAMTPQAWMDGKILGQMGVALAAVAQITVLGGLTIGALSVWRGRLPSLDLSPSLEALVFVPILSLLGLAFWFATFGAIAATIDDPNTSQRGSLLLLPALPAILPVFLDGFTDTAAAFWFGQLPLTSYAILPARLIAGDAAWWEPWTAIALLLPAIWMIRTAAGRIFAAGLLMYGKEPTLREMWRWARHGGG